MRLAVGRAKQASVRDVPILLTGESGTGKEMFARAIHQASRRKNNPFLTVNCAALPRELLEPVNFQGRVTEAQLEKWVVEAGAGGRGTIPAK